MDRSQRIQELQRKNRIKHICCQMQEVLKNLTIDNFLSKDATIRIEKEIIKKMDYMDMLKQRNIMQYNSNFESCILKNINLIENLKSQDLIIYIVWEKETYALRLSIEDVINNIKYLISMSSIANNGSSFIITSYNLDIGLCLWRTEYEIICYQW